MENSIEAANLTRKFGGFTAVDSISLKIKEGEIFGFLGPNGAGKTTTIKMLSTLLKPTSGQGIVFGFDVEKNPNEVRKSIGIVFQDPAVDSELTGRENLDFHARMYGLGQKERKERIAYVLNLVDLKDKADLLVKTYSGGMRRRLEIARGLMHSPKVLFLDEPTLGLDPQTRRQIWKYIENLNKVEKITILMTTHYMEEADQLCHRIGIIDKGKLIVTDTSHNLKKFVGQDMITIKAEKPEVLEKILKENKLFKKSKIHNSEIEISVDSAESKIPLITKLAAKNKIPLVSVSLRKPTLEDAFLYYTGSTIREEEGSGKDSFRQMAKMWGVRR